MAAVFVFVIERKRICLLTIRSHIDCLPANVVTKPPHSYIVPYMICVFSLIATINLVK